MITLYGVSGSPYVRKVQIVLAEKHLAYEMETVIPMVQPGGAVTTVWPGGGSVGYETIHPLKKVPALRDERGTLADSSVICAYLDRAYPDPQLYPSDPYLYGRALWFEEYGDTGLVAGEPRPDRRGHARGSNGRTDRRPRSRHDPLHVRPANHDVELRVHPRRPARPGPRADGRHGRQRLHPVCGGPWGGRTPGERRGGVPGGRGA